ncbi:hypothetical protein ACFSX9_15330 [Flavobacterium ardleyense]|uniref:Beta-lactamase n=1 Tax=Flavobacterium ardleyense TaxID=2038737 RepID=A0ABW5ZDE1_9FLAO
MKKLFMFVLISVLFIYCSDKVANAEENTDEPKGEIQIDNELKDIEKSVESFYDWYFANDLQYISIIKDKKGKCLLDSTTYFNSLRKLGTIS